MFRTIQQLFKYSGFLLVLGVMGLGGATASAQHLVQAEYFWDVDPGFGNGTALTAQDGSFDEAIETVIATGITAASPGLHTFGVRVNNTPNGWGSTFTTVIAVENAVSVQLPGVTAAEYFWDTDPGNGNGTALIAFDGNYDEALERALANGVAAPSTGLHTLNVRFQDPTTVWGPVFTTVVAMENPVFLQVTGLVAAEYYWDVDPGPGSATPMVAFDGNFGEAIEAAMTNISGGLSLGAHTFNARVRDSVGIWGPVFTTVVALEDTIPADPATLAKAEAFWDIDPGPGNGISLDAQDGSFDEALEMLVDSLTTFSLVPGPHRLSMRMQDDDLVWGALYSTVVWVDSSLTPITTSIVGSNQLNCNQNLNGLPYSTTQTTGQTYTWTVVGGAIASGQGTANITVNWSGTPPHTVSVQACNNNGCGNDFSMPVTILSSLNATLVANGQTTVCSGDSVLLNAPSGSLYDVVWLQNGLPVPGATDSTFQATSSGSYQVVLSNSGSCPDTSSAEVITVLSPLQVNAGTSQIFCFEDDSLTLGAAPTANGSQGPYTYAWSGLNLGSTTAANPMAAPTASTSYTVVVTDAAGCQQTDMVAITVNPALQISAGMDTILCVGETATLGGIPSGAGGTGSLSYQWTPSAGLSSATASNPVANSTALGMYVLQITDANGCQLHDTTEVMRHPALFADAGADTLMCGSGSYTLGGTSPASGGDGPYNLIWTPSTGLSNPTLGNPVANVTATTTYDLQVTDLNGCVTNDQVTVQVDPAPVAGYGFSTNLGTVTFVSSAQQANSVLWLFGDNNSSTIPNPVHTYQNSGVYDVCQVAYNTCGTDTFCQQVNVTVTGIEDGLAGDFKVYPNPHTGSFWLEMKSLEAEALTIRNTFGQVVFRETGFWSAGSRSQIQVNELPAGAYYLEVEGNGTTWTRRMVIMD